MKKIILSIIGILLLTGCGKKELSCSMVETTDGIKNTTEIKAEYKKEKISSIKLIIKLDLVDENITDKESFEFTTNTLKSIYDEYKDENITIDEDKEEKSYNITIEYKDDKIEQIKEVINIDTDNINNYKSSLEKEKYTCK